MAADPLREAIEALEPETHQSLRPLFDALIGDREEAVDEAWETMLTEALGEG